MAIDVVPRAPDLTLLGVKATSHLMNVTDSAAFRALCEKERPTHPSHAAHPPRDETPTVLDYCYKAMTNILEAAKDLKLQRVVYSSSASIYGQVNKPDGGLVKEDDAVTIYPTYFYRAAENRLRMDGEFLPGETWRRLRRSEIFFGRWLGALPQHPVGIEKRHSPASPAGPFSPARWTI